MAVAIISRIHRGRLFYHVPDVLFPTVKQAACAWSTAKAHRLDLVDLRGAA